MSTSAEYARALKILRDARTSIMSRLPFDGLVLIGTFRAENGVTVTAHAHDGNWHATTGLLQYAHQKRMGEASAEGAEQHAANSESTDNGDFDSDDRDPNQD